MGDKMKAELQTLTRQQLIALAMQRINVDYSTVIAMPKARLVNLIHQEVDNIDPVEA